MLTVEQIYLLIVCMYTVEQIYIHAIFLGLSCSMFYSSLCLTCPSDCSVLNMGWKPIQVRLLYSLSLFCAVEVQIERQIIELEGRFWNEVQFFSKGPDILRWLLSDWTYHNSHMIVASSYSVSQLGVKECSRCFWTFVLELCIHFQ